MLCCNADNNTHSSTHPSLLWAGSAPGTGAFIRGSFAAEELLQAIQLDDWRGYARHIHRFLVYWRNRTDYWRLGPPWCNYWEEQKSLQGPLQASLVGLEGCHRRVSGTRGRCNWRT